MSRRTIRPRPATSPFIGRIGLIRALMNLLRRHGFTDEEIAKIRAIFISRWSKQGDIASAAEQLARTLENFRQNQAIEQVIALGDEVFDTPQGRAAHRVVPITVGDIIDLTDIADGTSPPPASELIGYLLIRGDIAVLRVAYSGSIAGAIYDRRGEPTNIYTETLCQLLKAVRHHQAELGIAWRETDLSLRFSSDFTRLGRFAVEATRMFSWFTQLHVGWWLGNDAQATDRFAVLINAFRAHDAESKGADSTGRTNEGIVDHLSYPERTPMAENVMPVWRRHRADPDMIDGRARAGGIAGGRGSLLADWDVEVVPAVRAWLRAEAAGASHAEMAVLGIAHRIPTTRPGKTVGKRDSTMDRLPWAAARRRTANLLYLYGEPRRLDPVPTDGPNSDAIARANQQRLIYLDAARLGIERVTHRVPVTVVPSPTTYGQHQHPVLRDSETDHGYVMVPRLIGFPPAHTTRLESRTVRVPIGTFPDPSRVLGLTETPVSTTESEVTLDIEVIDAPVLDGSGAPVPWTGLGIEDEVDDKIIDRLTNPTNVGGRKGQAGEMPTVLPAVADHPLCEGDVEMVVRVRPEGPPTARARSLWVRPANRSGGWSLGEVRSVRAKDGTRRYLADNEDVTAWRRGYISERRLLESVANSFVEQAARAFDGDVELVLPLPRDHASNAAEVRRRQLEHQRDAASSARDDLLEDADGFDLLAGRRLLREDGEGSDKAEQKARGLRRQAEEQAGIIHDFDRQLAELATEADEVREVFLDERWLSHFAALLHKLAQPNRKHPAVIDEKPLLPIRHVCDRIFVDWRFTPPVNGYVGWSCTALIDTIDDKQVELPLCGQVKDTSDGGGWGPREDDELLHSVLSGTDIDTAITSLHRTTTRSAVVHTRLFPALGRLNIASRLKAALLDHPHTVAGRAVLAARTGIRTTQLTWGDGYEQWMIRRYSSGSWSRAACPTDVTEVMIIAACLNAHPETGVEINELVDKTGIPIVRIRRMVNPASAGRPDGNHPSGHIRRPAFFRWISPGIIGLHPCPHTTCRAESGWASIVVFLPETNPHPGNTGGVLCDTCLRLPIPGFEDVQFPEDYRHLVTGPYGTQGSIREQQLTVPAELPSVQAVNPPSGVTTAELVDIYGLSRFVIERTLHTAGIVPQRQKRAGEKIGAVYDATAAHRTIQALDLDAYGPLALPLARATAHAEVTSAQLIAATEAGELPVHRDGNLRRRWTIPDLDAWAARHRT